MTKKHHQMCHRLKLRQMQRKSPQDRFLLQVLQKEYRKHMFHLMEFLRHARIRSRYQTRSSANNNEEHQTTAHFDQKKFHEAGNEYLSKISVSYLHLKELCSRCSGYDVKLIRCCPEYDVKLIWRQHRMIFCE